MKNKTNKLILVFLLCLFLVDRISKFTALKLLEQGAFVIFKDFYLALVVNPFIAFSLPVPAYITIPLTLTLLLVLGFFIKSYSKDRQAVIALILMWLGAFSNLLDRFYYDGVVDFINIWFWPSFNLADVYIGVGVILLILRLKKENSLPNHSTNRRN